jgi:hypothetical protein
MIDARRIAESIAASFCCFRWSVTATLVALILGGVSTHNAFAQVASPKSPPQSSPSPSGVPTKEQDEQSKLTEGLLELLGQPENEKSGTGKATGPTTADSARNKNAIQPQDSPANPPKQAADPRSMGANDANPLAVVRDNMHSAASMMQQGRSDEQTLKLQDEIVKRLDGLIQQLEQQDQSMQRSSQKKQQSQQSSSSEKQPPQAKPQSKQSQEKSDSSPEQGNDAADGPGSSGKQANANVRTSDPAALQQNVWGHLPTRTRSQMQSRMVEEFLPSYRERIEAYYRALLEEGERK